MVSEQEDSNEGGLLWHSYSMLFFYVLTRIFQALHARVDNNVLRAENEMIRYENLAIREAMKDIICPSCGGQTLADEENEKILQKLQQENDQLKKEASSYL